MFIRTSFALYFVVWLSKFARCMESDICFPTKLEEKDQEAVDNLQTLEEKQAIKINAFNQEFVISLKQDSSFIAFFMPNTDLSSCFYSGHVNNDFNSYAALSLCKGVHGAFGFKGWEYFIRPAQNGTTRTERAHIIQRRRSSGGGSLKNSSASWCGVDTDVNLHEAQPPAKYKQFFTDNGNTTKNVPRRKAKRFVSTNRYVETLVVADATMKQFHKSYLKHYLLTLMSMVSKLFKHPSIENAISIAVVKLVILSEGDKVPEVSANATATLNNFCAWQKEMNKNDDTHPEYWDTAILFTRKDICRRDCNTLGLAGVGTMCIPERSCAVVEDNGLHAGFTAAHELGHVLNMQHDDGRDCEGLGKPTGNHIMSSKHRNFDWSILWSPCSATIVTDFLDDKRGDCLLDQPQKLLLLPKSLPGAFYDLNHQCMLAYGKAAKPCSSEHPPCSRLWCAVENDRKTMCWSRNFPWADGTKCGGRKICMQGECVNRNASRIRVDGQWGKWSEYGSCSRTCGGGTQQSKRECVNPPPVNGIYCRGLRYKYRLCNLNPCPKRDKTFREEQCETAGRKFIENDADWLPHYQGVSPNNRCKLLCRSTDSYYFFELAPRVVDGTPCSPTSTGVCVRGKCIEVGCDGELGSNKKVNKCGICGGDDEACEEVP